VRGIAWVRRPTCQCGDRTRTAGRRCEILTALRNCLLLFLVAREELHSEARQSWLVRRQVHTNTAKGQCCVEGACCHRWQCTVTLFYPKDGATVGSISLSCSKCLGEDKSKYRKFVHGWLQGRV
jgi:hypothetical protein